MSMGWWLFSDHLPGFDLLSKVLREARRTRFICAGGKRACVMVSTNSWERTAAHGLPRPALHEMVADALRAGRWW